MRIALLHPTYWPEVRRGSERLAHDLGAALAARGHRVTLLTSHRHRGSTSVEDGIRVVRRRRPPQLPGMHFYEDHVATAPGLIPRLVRGEFDVAHALFPVDGWAATQARRLGGPPYVFSVHGILNRRHLVSRRYRLEMFTESVRGASASTVLSAAAREPFRRYLLEEPVVTPGGVVCAHYGGEVRRTAEPSLLCPASLGDPRKRGGLLLAAFERLRQRFPEARLLLAGGRDPFAGAGAPRDLPPGAERVHAEDTNSLATAYRAAWVTVLPAIDEAFGLVLLESLAAGTPVVAASSGACPEIVTDEVIGRLFRPDDDVSLAAALERALKLAGDPATVDACRNHASKYDWNRVVERYEELYRGAVASFPGSG